MKRLLLTAFVAVALVGTASAQTTLNGGAFDLTLSANPGAVDDFQASAAIDVRTSVIEQLTVTAGRALDFGFVTAGVADSYSQMQTGQFTISGNQGATISLSQGTGTDLTLGTGVEVTGISYGGTGVSGSTLTLTGVTSATIDISGTLTTTTSAAAGNYSGTYQLDVAYTAI